MAQLAPTVGPRKYSRDAPFVERSRTHGSEADAARPAVAPAALWRGEASEARRVDLVLYVSPSSRYTHAARRNCAALVARFDQRHLRLEICDVSRNAERAEEDGVYYTPMLVKRHPLPRTFVLGDLSDATPVMQLLESCGVNPRR
jgi:hypothetical protein